MKKADCNFKDWKMISCSVVLTSDEGWLSIDYVVQDPQGNRHELHQCHHEDDLAYVFLEQELPRYIHESFELREEWRKKSIRSCKRRGIKIDDDYLGDWKYPILEMPAVKPSAPESS